MLENKQLDLSLRSVLALNNFYEDVNLEAPKDEKFFVPKSHIQPTEGISKVVYQLFNFNPLISKNFVHSLLQCWQASVLYENDNVIIAEFPVRTSEGTLSYLLHRKPLGGLLSATRFAPSLPVLYFTYLTKNQKVRFDMVFHEHQSYITARFEWFLNQACTSGSTLVQFVESAMLREEFSYCSNYLCTPVLLAAIAQHIRANDVQPQLVVAVMNWEFMLDSVLACVARFAENLNISAWQLVPGVRKGTTCPVRLNNVHTNPAEGIIVGNAALVKIWLSTSGHKCCYFIAECYNFSRDLVYLLNGLCAPMYEAAKPQRVIAVGNCDSPSYIASVGQFLHAPSLPSFQFIDHIWEILELTLKTYNENLPGVTLSSTFESDPIKSEKYIIAEEDAQELLAYSGVEPHKNLQSCNLAQRHDGFLTKDTKATPDDPLCKTDHYEVFHHGVNITTVSEVLIETKDNLAPSNARTENKFEAESVESVNLFVGLQESAGQIERTFCKDIKTKFSKVQKQVRHSFLCLASYLRDNSRFCTCSSKMLKAYREAVDMYFKSKNIGKLTKQYLVTRKLSSNCIKNATFSEFGVYCKKPYFYKQYEKEKTRFHRKKKQMHIQFGEYWKSLMKKHGDVASKCRVQVWVERQHDSHLRYLKYFKLRYCSKTIHKTSNKTIYSQEKKCPLMDTGTACKDNSTPFTSKTVLPSSGTDSFSKEAVNFTCADGTEHAPISVNLLEKMQQSDTVLEDAKMLAGVPDIIEATMYFKAFLGDEASFRSSAKWLHEHQTNLNVLCATSLPNDIEDLYLQRNSHLLFLLEFIACYLAKTSRISGDQNLNQTADTLFACISRACSKNMMNDDILKSFWNITRATLKYSSIELWQHIKHAVSWLNIDVDPTNLYRLYLRISFEQAAVELNYTDS